MFSFVNGIEKGDNSDGREYGVERNEGRFGNLGEYCYICKRYRMQPFVPDGVKIRERLKVYE